MKDNKEKNNANRANANAEVQSIDSETASLTPPQFSLKGAGNGGMNSILQRKESPESSEKDSSAKNSLGSEFIQSVDSIDLVQGDEMPDARGMTKNRSIFLPSSFDPENKEDRDTLGHEAAHAAQNHSAGRAPEPNAKASNGDLINNDETLESDAEAKGAKFAETMSGDDVSSLIQKKKAKGKSKEKASGQLKGGKGKKKKKKRNPKPYYTKVPFPQHYSETLLGVNATLQLMVIAEDVRNKILSFKKPSGWTSALKDYIPQGSLNIGEHINEGKKKNEDLDVSNISHKNDPKDLKRQHGGSGRYKNAVKTTKNVVTAGALQGAHKLAEFSEQGKAGMLKKLTEVGIDKLGLKSAKKTINDFVLEDPKKKLAEMGKGVITDVLSQKVMDQLVGSSTHSLNSIMTKAGYSSSKDFAVAQSHTREDLKQAIRKMVSHTRGVHFKREKYWSDFNKKSREGLYPLKDFIENESHKYLKINSSKAYKHNNVIFNSGFVGNFSKAYNLSKKGELSEKSRAEQVAENMGSKLF